MKYFDIVDEHDVVIGQRSAKECHSDSNLLHRVVHFTLINAADGTVLVARRPVENKVDGGKWCFLGEHVLAGEEYTDALYRGLYDELGIEKINSGTWGPPHIFAYASQRETARFFLAYVHPHHQLHPDPLEVADMRWVPLKQLQRNKERYSLITQFWIDNTWWEKAFNFARKGW